MRYKTIYIKLQFVNNLVEREKALGTCERLSKDNVITIQIDSRDNQLETISTLLHEFIHFIFDLMMKEKNYKKYFNPVISKNKVINVRKEFSEDDEYKLEEKICREIEKKAMKSIKKYLGLK